MMKLDRGEFARRRKRLMARMGENAIAILPAAPHLLRNRDAEYPYRQESNFYYLTGFGEPEAVAVLIPDRPQGEYLLFCRPRDAAMERWHGRRAGLEGAVNEYGAHEAFAMSEIDEILPGLMENRRRVYYAMGYQSEFDQKVMAWLNTLRRRARAGIHAPGEFVALDHLLHEMRLYKSKAELKVMRRAATITAEAHRRAMQCCRPGMMEYQIEAEILHTFTHHGARSPAYNSIVGSGANGCILHYVENSARLRSGDLLLIDAGCEVDHYASDITRTFPINGRFSDEQRQLYELVLAAQAAAFAKVKPGNHWNEPHEAVVKVLTRGLVKLGILEGNVNRLIKEEAYRTYFMHRTGHWLGMDVHDVGDYKNGDRWRTLEEGMVFTVEPGLYIAAESPCDRRWWGIGIRIEDNLLVTRKGYEILTDEVPRDIAAIEALMQHE
jgi:Xaa-Pro aminopeptidase